MILLLNNIKGIQCTLYRYIDTFMGKYYLSNFKETTIFSMEQRGILYFFDTLTFLIYRVIYLCLKLKTKQNNIVFKHYQKRPRAKQSIKDHIFGFGRSLHH